MYKWQHLAISLFTTQVDSSVLHPTPSQNRCMLAGDIHSSPAILKTSHAGSELYQSQTRWSYSRNNQIEIEGLDHWRLAAGIKRLTIGVIPNISRNRWQKMDTKTWMSSFRCSSLNGRDVWMKHCQILRHIFIYFSLQSSDADTFQETKCKTLIVKKWFGSKQLLPVWIEDSYEQQWRNPWVFMLSPCCHWLLTRHRFPQISRVWLKARPYVSFVEQLHCAVSSFCLWSSECWRWTSPRSNPSSQRLYLHGDIRDRRADNRLCVRTHSVFSCLSLSSVKQWCSG